MLRNNNLGLEGGMDLSTQQRAFAMWLDAAGGQVALVERALIEAREENHNHAPTFSQVLNKIRALRSQNSKSLVDA